MRGHRQLMYGGIQAVIATGNDPSQQWPANDPDFLGASWVEFYFYLVQVNGAPTAAKLQAKFQKAAASSDATEWATPVWQDFEDYDVQQRCLGGLAWGSSVVGGTSYPRAVDHNYGTLHDSSISASMTLGYLCNCRVISPPGKMRVILLPTFTAGTSPSYSVVGYYEVGYAG